MGGLGIHVFTAWVGGGLEKTRKKGYERVSKTRINCCGIAMLQSWSKMPSVATCRELSRNCGRTTWILQSRRKGVT